MKVGSVSYGPVEAPDAESAIGGSMVRLKIEK
jgi:hypothetical protein